MVVLEVGVQRGMAQDPHLLFTDIIRLLLCTLVILQIDLDHCCVEANGLITEPVTGTAPKAWTLVRGQEAENG